jgi:hypothetical protein
MTWSNGNMNARITIISDNSYDSIVVFIYGSNNQEYIFSFEKGIGLRNIGFSSVTKCMMCTNDYFLQDYSIPK